MNKNIILLILLFGIICCSGIIQCKSSVRINRIKAKSNDVVVDIPSLEGSDKVFVEKVLADIGEFAQALEEPKLCTKEHLKEITGKDEITVMEYVVLSWTNLQISVGEFLNCDNLRENLDAVVGHELMSVAMHLDGKDSELLSPIEKNTLMAYTSKVLENTGETINMEAIYQQFLKEYEIQAKEDIKEIKDAVDGMGTDEEVVYGILGGKTRDEIDILEKEWTKMVELGDDYESNEGGIENFANKGLLLKRLGGDFSNGDWEKLQDMYNGKPVGPNTKYYWKSQAAEVIGEGLAATEEYVKKHAHNSESDFVDTALSKTLYHLWLNPMEYWKPAEKWGSAVEYWTRGIETTEAWTPSRAANYVMFGMAIIGKATVGMPMVLLDPNAPVGLREEAIIDGIITVATMGAGTAVKATGTAVVKTVKVSKDVFKGVSYAAGKIKFTPQLKASIAASKARAILRNVGNVLKTHITVATEKLSTPVVDFVSTRFAGIKTAKSGNEVVKNYDDLARSTGCTPKGMSFLEVGVREDVCMFTRVVRAIFGGSDDAAKTATKTTARVVHVNDPIVLSFRDRVSQLWYKVKDPRTYGGDLLRTAKVQEKEMRLCEETLRILKSSGVQNEKVLMLIKRYEEGIGELKKGFEALKVNRNWQNPVEDVIFRQRNILSDIYKSTTPLVKLPPVNSAIRKKIMNIKAIQEKIRADPTRYWGGQKVDTWDFLKYWKNKAPTYISESEPLFSRLRGMKLAESGSEQMILIERRIDELVDVQTQLIKAQSQQKVVHQIDVAIKDLISVRDHVWGIPNWHHSVYRFNKIMEETRESIQRIVSSKIHGLKEPHQYNFQVFTTENPYLKPVPQRMRPFQEGAVFDVNNAVSSSVKAN